MHNTYHQEIEQLFIRLYEPLCRYAFTILKNAVDAEDVVQGVFLRFIEKQEVIDIQVSARPYLYKMVYHAALNHLRKEETEKKYQLQSGTLEEGIHPDLFSDELQQEMRQRIDQVLDQLPPQCRTVFMKSRVDNMKYSKIAAALGLSVKTVEAHMSKALKIIRGVLRVFVPFIYLTTKCVLLNSADCGI